VCVCVCLDGTVTLLAVEGAVSGDSKVRVTANFKCSGQCTGT